MKKTRSILSDFLGLSLSLLAANGIASVYGVSTQVGYAISCAAYVAKIYLDARNRRAP